MDIYKKLKTYTYISFDLFDTLIKRQVAEPEDIFTLVEIEYNHRFLSEGTLSLTNFKEKRIAAFARAKKLFNNSCCSIDEIYSCINISGIDTNKLKALEIEIELSMCVPNYPILELYNKFKADGKQIIIISDMYLPSNILKKILSHNNITGYIELFVSCEYGCSKTDGSLYDAACAKLTIPARQLAHIGDGWKNDFLRAKQKKIFACHIPRTKKLLSYYSEKEFGGADLFTYRTLQTISNNQLSSTTSDFEKLGCELLGPLVYGFSQWLYEKLNEQQINKVFFLAREGKILLEAFQFLFNDSSIETAYLYASRRSLIIPTYWIAPTLQEITRSMSMPKYIKICDLFHRWGLDSNKYKKLFETMNLLAEDTILSSKINTDPQMKQLFESVKNDIVSHSKQEYEKLKEYLIQEKFNGNIAIVDVGWNGGMQKALERLPYIKESSSIIHGFYFGINGRNLNTKFRHAYGYLYENDRNPQMRYWIYGFAGPLELSMTADHGSTCNYSKNGDTITPVLLPHEYIDSAGNDTKELRCAKEMQKGLWNYLNAIKKLSTVRKLHISSHTAFRNYLLFGTQPYRKHIHLFDNYKAMDLKSEQVFIGTKYKHLYGKYNIKKGFWLSTWKIGFIKYILRFPFPYKNIYWYFKSREE